MMFTSGVEKKRRVAGAPAIREPVRHHHPDFNARETHGWKAVEAEGRLSEDGWRREQQWALDMGLPGADSIIDRSIPTFARGELPHFAGINTFLKAP
jgi:agmatinase